MFINFSFCFLVILYMNDFNITVQLSVEVFLHNTISSQSRRQHGRSDGGYIGIYTLPKSGQVNFLWSNNNVRLSTYYVLWNAMSIKILYLPKTDFWLRPWPSVCFCTTVCNTTGVPGYPQIHRYTLEAGALAVWPLGLHTPSKNPSGAPMIIIVKMKKLNE